MQKCRGLRLCGNSQYPDSSTPSSTATDYELPDNTGTDTDGDGVCDIVERYVGTNLSIQDTDGDGYTDYTEIYEYAYDPTNNPYSFSPLIADVPRIAIRLASTPVIGLKYTTSEGESTEISTSDSTSNSSSHALGGSVTVTVGVEQEVNYSKDGVGGTTRGKFEVAGTFSYQYTSEKTSTHEESESKLSESTISFDSGYLKTALNIGNTGIIGYNLTNLLLSAYIIDTEEEGLINPTPIDNLELSAGSLGITLDSGMESSNLVFSNNDLDLDTTYDLLEDAEGLILQVSGYQLTDDEGNTFTETRTEVNAKTARVYIEYGFDDSNEEYLVATNINSNDLGVSLKDVLDSYFYIPYETGDQGNITSVRGFSTENRETDQWKILHYYTDTGVDETALYNCDDTIDLSQITLKAGDCLYLVLVRDSDGDGTTDRIEAINNYGESEAPDDYESIIRSNTDTDGDGMADDIDNDPYYPNIPVTGCNYAAMIKTNGRIYNYGSSSDCYFSTETTAVTTGRRLT